MLIDVTMILTVWFDFFLIFESTKIMEKIMDATISIGIRVGCGNPAYGGMECMPGIQNWHP